MIITVTKIVDGSTWYFAEDIEKTAKKSAFNKSIKFGFDKTEFKYNTVYNVYNEYKEISLKEAPYHSVIEYDNNIWLVTGQYTYNGLTTICPVTHTRKKQCKYDILHEITINNTKKVDLLTSTFESFCNIYKMHGI